MDLIPSKKILILKIFLSIIFFLTISLFFSAQKISLLLVFTIIFFLLKTNYQKVIVINLILLTVFIKIIILPFQLKTQEINPSKVEIYEKHFLYGVKNINFNKSYINGDLSSLDKKYKEKYRNLNNKIALIVLLK